MLASSRLYQDQHADGDTNTVLQYIMYRMCSALKRRFLLLYGTQRGQSKAIAEEIGQQAEQYGFVADVFSLEDMNKFNLENEKDPVVVVISTTGTGDPPDAALKFVKKIQNKALTDDSFAHLRYGLLALGDSEYTYFCNGGKIVDRRLQELGATHFYETGYADDCVGLELVVDPWIEDLWIALEKEFLSRAENKKMIGEINDVTSENHNIPKVPGNLDMHLQAISLESELPSDRRSLNKAVSDAFKEFEHSLVHSVPPLSQCSLNIPALRPVYLDVLILDCKAKEIDSSFLHPEVEIFTVPIKQAKRLTAKDSVKTTLKLELDISNTTIDFQPGDSFGIICPNPPDEVTDLVNKLGLSDKKDCQVFLTVKSEIKGRGVVIPDYIPERCSLQYLLTWCLEICALPKKAFLRALAEYTSDVAETRRLLELCSKQGNSDYNGFIREHAISVVDLLNAFPSCQPPLGLLIEHLPKLQPRSYSAASSSLFHPGKLCFVFNIVNFEPCLGRTLPRKGVCTGYLAELVRRNAEESKAIAVTGNINLFTAEPKISIFIRPSTLFHLPLDSSVPIIMVGPGTGIAPFIGFLQHREIQRQQKKECIFGDTWLFYGCRSHDKDYLFRDELRSFVENGTLTHLKVCFSREASCATDYMPKYVQEYLQIFSQDIVQILTKENGCFYVCGDAKNMAKDVNNSLADILCAELCVDKLDAMKILASLKDEKRYLQEIWG
ncbi:methionine synthase reductase isoform X1 [Bufo gargarizans]|uniref:methionine synthase reductase isoform X1 n=2 Tax=Bufo gargarizans TaxID=30331 RepID=UPI001CF5B28A|nr:methionine synthase reductase isoform X1 [Bufo gargarizans]